MALVCSIEVMSKLVKSFVWARTFLQLGRLHYFESNSQLWLRWEAWDLFWINSWTPSPMSFLCSLVVALGSFSLWVDEIFCLQESLMPMGMEWNGKQILLLFLLRILSIHPYHQMLPPGFEWVKWNFCLWQSRNNCVSRRRIATEEAMRKKKGNRKDAPRFDDDEKSHWEGGIRWMRKYLIDKDKRNE